MASQPILQLVPGTSEFLLGVAQALLLQSPLPLNSLLRGDPPKGQAHQHDQEEQLAYRESREPVRACGGFGHLCPDCFPR